MTDNVMSLDGKRRTKEFQPHAEDLLILSVFKVWTFDKAIENVAKALGHEQERRKDVIWKE